MDCVTDPTACSGLDASRSPPPGIEAWGVDVRKPFGRWLEFRVPVVLKRDTTSFIFPNLGDGKKQFKQTTDSRATSSVCRLDSKEK